MLGRLDARPERVDGVAGLDCDDLGAECQRLNRRVHIEMRRLAPPAATFTAPAPTPATAHGATSSASPSGPAPLTVRGDEITTP